MNHHTHKEQSYSVKYFYLKGMNMTITKGSKNYIKHVSSLMKICLCRWEKVNNFNISLFTPGETQCFTVPQYEKSHDCFISSFGILSLR